MEEPLLTILKLVAVALLIFANAFFVAAEFALVSIRRTRVEELIADGNQTARVVRRAIQEPNRFIAATQLGITVAGLGLGWIGEPALAHLIEPAFLFLPDAWIGPAVHAVAASAITFILITFLLIVVGELAPKSVALAYPEQTALWVARPTQLFATVFRPAIWALNGAGNAVLKIVGLRRPTGYQLVHSVEELKMLVSATAESGELEPSEKTMLHNVFEFSDRLVREAMTPRPDMVALNENTTIEEFLQTFKTATHSRFPVYVNNVDNIMGFVAIKDVLRALASDEPNIRQQPVRTLVRPALFVPESMRVGRLFADMQAQKIQIAIVIDEYGGTAGMVTLEGLIEEIVGHLGDEFADEPQVEMIDERSAQFDGQLRVDQVNAELGIQLPESADYETLAGLILYQLHHIPKEGEQFRMDNVRITVTQMQGPKIEKVLITRM